MASLATPPPAAPPSAPAASATPATPVSTPAAQPRTMSEVLASVLGPEPPAPSAPATPEAAPQVPATAAPEIAPETPPAAEPVAPAVEGTPEAAAFEEEIKPDSVDAEGRRHFYTKAKSERLQAANNTLRQLNEIVPNLTVDGFKDIVGRATAADTMMNLFHRAAASTAPQESTQAMDEILGMFREENPVSFGIMALRAHSMLPHVNPEAAKYINDFHTQRFINDARGRIAQIVDPVKRQEEARFVQHLEQRFLGRFTPEADLLNGARPDPVRAQMEEIERGRREIREFQENQRKQAIVQRRNDIASKEEAAIMGAVDSFLAPVKTNFQANDLDGIRTALRDEIDKAERLHPEWGEMYQSLLMQAENTGSPQDIQRLTDFRKSIAERVARLNGRSVVASRTGSIVANNQAAIERSANAPRNEPAPNGVGTPASPNGVDAMLKADNWKDMMKALFS